VGAPWERLAAAHGLPLAFLAGRIPRPFTGMKPKGARSLRRGDIETARPAVQRAPPSAVPIVLPIDRKLIGSLGKGGLSKHVLSVDDEQQIVSRLEVNVPGIPRCPGIIKRGFRGSRTSTTQKPCKEHMRDIGIAAVHHELHAVRTPALIAMPNEPHVVRIIRHGKVARPHS
jgi:hypothetical protein